MDNDDLKAKARESAQISAMWAHSADLVVEAMRALRFIISDFCDDKRVMLTSHAIEAESLTKFIEVLMEIDAPLAIEVTKILMNDKQITASDALQAGVMNLLFGETGDDEQD